MATVELPATGGTPSYSASDLTLGASQKLIWTGRSTVESAADGTLLMKNSAGTGFTGLQLGGTTTSFPMLKRNATAVNVRLADDSADAPLTCSSLTTSAQVLVPDGSAA